MVFTQVTDYRRSPDKNEPRGYIVNVDKHDQPGSHWIGVWTENEVCEVMDSFGLTIGILPTFRGSRKWIDKFDDMKHSTKTLQDHQ